MQCPNCGGYKTIHGGCMSWIHPLLIICTFGLWLIVLIPWRLLTRNRVTTLECPICGSTWRG